MPEKYLMKTIKVAPSLQICMRILFVNMLYAVIVMLLLSYSDKVFKGTDRLCKVFKLSVYAVLRSLSAWSTFKIINLGGYVLRNGILKLLNNKDEN